MKNVCIKYHIRGFSVFKQVLNLIPQKKKNFYPFIF